MDVYKLISLYKTISSDVICQIYLNDNKKNFPIRIKSKVSDAIVSNASEILKTAIRAENYEGNSDIKILANSLYRLKDTISDETIRKVIDDVYDITPKDRLVHYMYDNDKIPQIVGGVVHIFKKLQDKGNVYNTRIR